MPQPEDRTEALAIHEPLFETAVATAYAITSFTASYSQYTRIDGVSPVQSDTGDHWSVTIEPDKTRRFIVEPTGGGGVAVRRRNQATGKTETLSVTSLSDRATLAKATVRAMLGVDYIPIRSRKEMRRTLIVARQDADYYHRVGMAYLRRPFNDGLALAYGAADSDSDRWDVIMQAFAKSKARDTFGFMWYYRHMRVPMHVFDVYDDAHIERAAELLASTEV